jgi:hypothetical protein
VSGSNFAEISYNENSSGFNFLQLRGNTAFRVTENLKSRFNMGADYYLDGRYNLYDTWLELERKNTVLRVGNVNSNDYDYPVFGRGGKVSTKFGKIIRLKFLRWKIIIICTVLISNKQKDLPWWVQNTVLEMLNLSMEKYLIYSTMIRALT